MFNDWIIDSGMLATLSVTMATLFMIHPHLVIVFLFREPDSQINKKQQEYSVCLLLLL